jgi:diacylglycerol kinase
MAKDTPRKSYRRPGIAGDKDAAMIAVRAFVALLRSVRPLRIQLALGLGMLFAISLRAIVLGGLGFYSWLFVICAHLSGIRAEAVNTIFERCGDAIAVLVAQERLNDPTFLDHPYIKGEPYNPEWNEYTKDIKDGGAATVLPAFVLALLVDIAVLIHG